MLTSKVAIAVALWTLLIAPFFCGLGMVVHACLDDDGPDCHHEVSCEADPCQVILLQMNIRDESTANVDQYHFMIEWDNPSRYLSFTSLDRLRPIVVLDDSLPETIICTRTLPLIC